MSKSNKTTTKLDVLRAAFDAGEQTLADVVHDQLALPERRRMALLSCDADRVCELRREAEDIADRLLVAAIALEQARSLLRDAEADDLFVELEAAAAVAGDAATAFRLVADNDGSRSAYAIALSLHQETAGAHRVLLVRHRELLADRDRALRAIATKVLPSRAEVSPVVRSTWQAKVNAADQWGSKSPEGDPNAGSIGRSPRKPGEMTRQEYLVRTFGGGGNGQ